MLTLLFELIYYILSFQALAAFLFVIFIDLFIDHSLKLAEIAILRLNIPEALIFKGFRVLHKIP